MYFFALTKGSPGHIAVNTPLGVSSGGYEVVAGKSDVQSEKNHLSHEQENMMFPVYPTLGYVLIIIWFSFIVAQEGLRFVGRS